MAGVLIAPLAGCYQYVAIGTAVRPDTASGTRAVHLELTAAGTEAVATTLGRDITSLSGRQQPSRGDTIVVKVSRTWHRSGYDESRLGDVVRLLPSHVEVAAERRLSVLRTVLLGAAVGGGLAILPGLVTRSGSAGGDPGGGGGGGTPP
jgi:predicted short-subunit dehydrogenase-like oxidoreductase (DUF2520 family)